MIVQLEPAWAENPKPEFVADISLSPVERICLSCPLPECEAKLG